MESQLESHAVVSSEDRITALEDELKEAKETIEKQAKEIETLKSLFKVKETSTSLPTSKRLGKPKHVQHSDEPEIIQPEETPAPITSTPAAPIVEKQSHVQKGFNLFGSFDPNSNPILARKQMIKAKSLDSSKIQLSNDHVDRDDHAKEVAVVETVSEPEPIVEPIAEPLLVPVFSELLTWLKTHDFPETNEADFKNVIKDGVLLVKLVNAVNKTNLKVNTGRFTFCHAENIDNFCRSVGLKKEDFVQEGKLLSSLELLRRREMQV